MNPRWRGLVFAYACAPGWGSEPAAGWGIVRAIVASADCVALVGPEHGEALRRWQASHTGDPTTFVVVLEPWWAAFVPRTRIGRFLIYLGWLPAAAACARRMGLQQFDFAWHVTYSAYWLSTPATKLGLPCVWGPVGGAVTTPRALWPALGWRGALTELLDFVAVRLMACWPPTRETWHRATVTLVQNEATLNQLPADVRSRAVVMNHALFTEVPPAPTQKREPLVVFAASFESRKAPSLAIRALAHTPEPVRLLMIGDGPEARSLAVLARRLRVEHRVKFAGRLSHDAVLGVWRNAGAAIFTGLREEGGIALAEAMLSGTPVIVLSNGGARTIARMSTDPARVALIEPSSVDVVVRAMAEAMTRFALDPSSDASPLLDTEHAVRRVEQICMKAATEHRRAVHNARVGGPSLAG